MSFNTIKIPGDIIQSGDWNTFVDFTEATSSNSYKHSSNTGLHWDSSYLGITVDTNSTAATSADIFDSDSYASYSYTDDVTAKNITYTSTNGKFTFDTGGVYMINFTPRVVGSVNGNYGVEVYINDSLVNRAINYINTVIDPLSVPVSIIKSLNATDYMNIKIGNTGGVSTIQLRSGSSLAIARIG